MQLIKAMILTIENMNRQTLNNLWNIS